MADWTMLIEVADRYDNSCRGLLGRDTTAMARHCGRLLLDGFHRIPSNRRRLARIVS